MNASRESTAGARKSVRLAEKMQAGPCIPVGVQLEKAEVGQLLGQLGVLLTMDDAVILRHRRLSLTATH